MSSPLTALRAITRERIAYRQAHGETLEAATADALAFAASLTTAMDSGVLEFVAWMPRGVREVRPHVHVQAHEQGRLM